ncbi:MAG: hypothetical protein LBT79_03100, partial [Elusimicrobiota bacterium]|nr:hypothetical protein [Elusimicrobiota bacterium]
ESDGWVDHDSYVSSMNPYSKTIETILLLSIADFRGDMGSVAKYTFVMVDVETNKIVAKKTITITR